MRDDLNEELRRGNDLATALVDHLQGMGGAGACIIPVQDRAEECVVIVMPKASYDARAWPINSPNDEMSQRGKGGSDGR